MQTDLEGMSDAEIAGELLGMAEVKAVQSRAADEWNNNQPGVGQWLDYKETEWGVVALLREAARRLQR